MEWKVDREFGMKDDWEEKKMGNEVSNSFVEPARCRI